MLKYRVICKEQSLRATLPWVVILQPAYGGLWLALSLLLLLWPVLMQAIVIAITAMYIIVITAEPMTNRQKTC